MDSEEFEEVPWSQLIPDTTSGGNRTVVIAGGIVVALLVGVFGARLLGGDGRQTVLEPVAPSGPVVAEAPVAAPPLTAPPTTVAANVLYAEADLMASIVPSAEPAVSATYFATRFVRDFFTVDGDSVARSRLAALFIDGDQLPLPHGQGTPTTYVEWVEVVRSVTTVAGLDVVVAFQMLEESDDGGSDFVRSEVLEATVSLVATNGGYAVASLPRVSASAVPAPMASWTGSATAPPWVVDAAMREIGVFAADASVIATELLDGGDWRVVLLANRSGGVSWPLQVLVQPTP
ncbi:MAG TPA: hypothetical protein ENG98_01875 [Actinobacteria bacterium]|nr:hypothetical protein [Actinomycetota bacterium]